MSDFIAKTTSSHYNNFAAVRAEYDSSGLHSQQNGRSYFYACCPWCHTDILCYPWSIAGCGRRCPRCGAMLSYGGTAYKMQNYHFTRGATFSLNRTRRYVLWRGWDKDKPSVAFIGLNPGKSNESHNDSTTLLCQDIAKDTGFGSMILLNIFGFIDTHALKLIETEDPIGRFNDGLITRAVSTVDTVVLCWGARGVWKNRGRQVVEVLARHLDRAVNPPKLCTFGLTGKGEPARPIRGCKMRPAKLREPRW